MAQLDAARTVSDTVANHVSDHNVLHGKANYIHDVMDYGATGDGSNDSLAVQSAIDDAEVLGGMVALPKGTFDINVTVHSDKVMLQGVAPLQAPPPWPLSTTVFSSPSP